MTLLTFFSMIAIPLVASLLVYLSGRLGIYKPILHRSSYLVRGLSLLTILLTWIPFVVSAQTLLAENVQEFNLEAIWL